MKGAQGYVALILDEATKRNLEEFTIHPVKYCSHVTMAYRPTPEIYAKYALWMGQTLEFSIFATCQDLDGQAALVDAVPTENTRAHITMSCREGIKPSHSNELINDPNICSMPLWLRGRGTVQWVNF